MQIKYFLNKVFFKKNVGQCQKSLQNVQRHLETYQWIVWQENFTSFDERQRDMFLKKYKPSKNGSVTMSYKRGFNKQDLLVT